MTHKPHPVLAPLFLLPLFIHSNWADPAVILTAPVISSLGEWTTWADCPENYFVTGADLHWATAPRTASPHSPPQDALGLVNFVIECRNVFDPPGQQTSEFRLTEMPGVSASVIVPPRPLSKPISTANSTLHPGNVPVLAGGTVTVPPIEYTLPLRMQCPGLVTGFALNLAPLELASDNTGANNVRLYCSGLRATQPDFIEGYGEYRGQWSSPQKCPDEHAICGVQAQADDLTQSRSDFFGLNSLRFKCCRVPNPASTCIPTDAWELIEECDNLRGQDPVLCSYEKAVGVGASSGKSNELYEQFRLYEGLGFSLKGRGAEDGESDVADFWLSGGLSENFRVNVGQSDRTDHNWASSSERTWGRETVAKTRTMTFPLEQYTKAYIYQVVGTCGYFTARTSSFRTDIHSERHLRSPYKSYAPFSP